MYDSFKFINGCDYEPFTKKEEVEAFTEYNKTKCPNLKNKILEKNLRLVIKIVHDEFARRVQKNSFYKNSFDESDLIAEGCIGANTAIDKFDVTRGIKFSTYCSFWIRQQVLRYIANNARTIRLPVNFSEKMIKVKEYIREYDFKHNQKPSKKQILNKFKGLSSVALNNILCTSSTLYLHQTFDAEDECELGDTIPDEKNIDPSLLVSEKLEGNDIQFFLNQLTQKEKDIIIKRFGFGGGKPMRLEEIGSEYNVTRERIRQIQTGALMKLGKMIEKSKDVTI